MTKIRSRLYELVEDLYAGLYRGHYEALTVTVFFIFLHSVSFAFILNFNKTLQSLLCKYSTDCSAISAHVRHRFVYKSN